MRKPVVLINLDRPRRLRYTTNALANMEEALKKPIGQLVNDFSSGLFGFRDIRAIVWAGLLHESPDLTQSEVGDMIDQAESFPEVVRQVGEALRAAFGEKTGEAKNGAGPAAGSGTGTEPSP